MSWYFLLLPIKLKIYGFPMDFRKISIITPSLNRACLVKSAIQSVADQNYPNCELLIIDGSSTDNPEEVIQKNRNIIWEWIV